MIFGILSKITLDFDIIRYLYRLLTGFVGIANLSYWLSAPYKIVHRKIKFTTNWLSITYKIFQESHKKRPKDYISITYNKKVSRLLVPNVTLFCCKSRNCIKVPDVFVNTDKHFRLLIKYDKHRQNSNSQLICHCILWQHHTINLILHRVKYFNRVAIESAFLPTFMYSSSTLGSNFINSSISIRMSFSR